MSKIDTFTHCHLHSSAGSFLDGVGKCEEYMQRALEMGQRAVAITEHGSMASAYEFQSQGDKYGIKTILGNEMYCVEDRFRQGLTDEEKDGLTPTEVREANKKRIKSPHLLLLAETDEGLQNLYRLNYYAATEGFYGKPRIDLKLLAKYSKGLIATTTCVISNMARYFQNKEIDKMTGFFKDLAGIFGPDNLFIEMHPHDLDMQLEYNQVLIEMFRKEYEEFKCILANDVHYVMKEHSDTHSFLWRLNTDGRIDEAGVDSLYMTSEDEIREMWHKNGHADIIGEEYLEEAIESTKTIANRCNARLDVKTLKEPKFNVPNGYKDGKAYILELLQKGMADKVRNKLIAEEDIPEYVDRLKTELDLISDKGYIDYFLITNDFTQWAYENDILMSPGRGSASGSLICWLLGITHLNPIKYELFFERFMNPERIKEPDIDNDFQDNRRTDVKRYIAQKWGIANIASVCA